MKGAENQKKQQVEREGEGMNVSNIIDGIEQRASESIKAEQGDYIVDGLLYCGKCNTPKQCRVEILGTTRTQYCICKCETERRDREEAERQRIKYEQHIKDLRRAGFPDDEMQQWTFDKDDGANEHITRVARKYVDNFKIMRESGKGLLLYGTVGTGKTFTAACIANALIDKGFPCLVTNFARLINTISGMYDGKQEYIDRLNRFALLVIDDLATEADTEYRNEIVFNIIDSRYRAGLPLIVTTNLTAQELKNSADIKKQRIYSRLFERCIPLEVKGVDRRRERLKDDYKTFSEMLGL